MISALPVASLLLFALFPACQTPVPPTLPPADTAPGGDTADTAADVGVAPPPPSLTPTEVELVAAALLGDALPDPASLLEHWRSLFFGASLPCPGITGPYSIAAPFEGCLATDGRIWAGYAVYSVSADAPVDVALAADATVTTPDGRTFLAAGQVTLTNDGAGVFSSMVVGTWGGADDPDWTGPGPSVALFTTGTTTSAALYGGISLDQDAIYLDDLTWDAAACPGASGTLRVRDPGGWWYTVALAADCSGCGELTYEGDPLGIACVPVGDAIAAMVDRTEGG